VSAVTAQETEADQALPPALDRFSWPRLGNRPISRDADGQLTPGNGGALRWLFSSVWLVYLIQPIADLFEHKHGHYHSVLYIACGLLIAVAFCVIYVPVIVDADEHPRFSRYGLIGLVVLSILGCAVYGQDWLPLWIYVSAATGQVLGAGPWGKQVTFQAVLGVCVVYTIMSVVTHFSWGNYLALLLPVLLIGWAMMGFRLQIELMHQLAKARDTVARMAVSEERLRLARDMHDLTGQSLSMITLKSDLAAKRLSLLPESPERDAITRELQDIGQVSRQTLHDIREAVSGYRQPTLSIEAITARTALEAAGIALDDDSDLMTRSGTFDPDAEAALAWCLREAVTNVIRHSAARTCRIRLTCPPGGGRYTLEITDDGKGYGSSQGVQAGPAGNGLRNMSERLSAVGGSLSLSGGQGFRLVATVPA
jgi:two-component system, NarL family, sensor histidine kinase DesK